MQSDQAEKAREAHVAHEIREKGANNLNLTRNNDVQPPEEHIQYLD